jgi:beta-lactamase superfamily II metal-dependent hydrolase
MSLLSKKEATTIGLDTFTSPTAKIELYEISNEELLSGVYDERTVLPVLKERGIKDMPKDVAKGY